jgi:hypothetical protein
VDDRAIIEGPSWVPYRDRLDGQQIEDVAAFVVRATSG